MAINSRGKMCGSRVMRRTHQSLLLWNSPEIRYVSLARLTCFVSCQAGKPDVLFGKITIGCTGFKVPMTIVHAGGNETATGERWNHSMPIASSIARQLYTIQTWISAQCSCDVGNSREAVSVLSDTSELRSVTDQFAAGTTNFAVNSNANANRSDVAARNTQRISSHGA